MRIHLALRCSFICIIFASRAALCCSIPWLEPWCPRRPTTTVLEEMYILMMSMLYWRLASSRNFPKQAPKSKLAPPRRPISKQHAWLDSTHRKTNTLTTEFSVRHFALLSYSKSTREEIWRWVGLESEREVVEILLRDFVADIRFQACARDFFFGVDQAWVFICMRGWGACREWLVRARPKMDHVPISNYSCITWFF